MKKKLICMLLAGALVATTSAGAVFADKHGKKDEPRNKIEEKMQDIKDKAKEKMEERKEKAKEAFEDKKEKAKEAFENKMDKAKEKLDESVHKSVYRDVYQSETIKSLQEKLKVLREQQKDYEKQLQAEIKALREQHKSVFQEVYGDQIKAIQKKMDDLKKDALKQNKEMIKKMADMKRKNNFKGILVFVNGMDINFDVLPVIKDGRTLIPVKAVTNALGSNVAWDPATKTATVTSSVYSDTYGKVDTIITIKIDSKVVLANGQQIQLDVPAQIVQGRTMVPIAILAKILKKNVEWDKELSTVIIDD